MPPVRFPFKELNPRPRLLSRLSSLGCLEIIEQRQLDFVLGPAGLDAQAAIDPARNSDILVGMFDQDGQFNQRFEYW